MVLCNILFFNPYGNCEWGYIISPILQMRKMKLREAEDNAQGHTVDPDFWQTPESEYLTTMHMSLQFHIMVS